MRGQVAQWLDGAFWVATSAALVMSLALEGPTAAPLVVWGGGVCCKGVSVLLKRSA